MPRGARSRPRSRRSRTRRRTRSATSSTADSEGKRRPPSSKQGGLSPQQYSASAAISRHPFEGLGGRPACSPGRPLARHPRPGDAARRTVTVPPEKATSSKGEGFIVIVVSPAFEVGESDSRLTRVHPELIEAHGRACRRPCRPGHRPPFVSADSEDRSTYSPPV